MAESTWLQRKSKRVSSFEENIPMTDSLLSDLPDDLICHILSFLSTKEACRTSILSTRWRYLWTMVPVLDFHINSPSNKKKRERFVHSVITVLFQRNAQGIRKFRLYCCCEPYHLHAWICYALGCNVEELDLDIHLMTATSLPPSLFTCRTLVVLKLQSNNIIPEFPPCIYLPSLKNFHLYLVDILSSRISEEDDFLSDFLSCCPVLEEINLSGSGKLPGWIKISVPSLKTLSLDFSGFWFRTVLKKIHKLQINTPSLEVLNLSDNNHHEYLKLNLYNVDRATLSIQKPREYNDDLFKLFEILSNVKSLSLGSPTVRYLGGGLDKLRVPEFHNLLYLWVELPQDYRCWHFIPRFLHKSQKLQVLVIQKKFKRNKFKKVVGESSWTRSASVPVCLSSNLKRFEFRGIQNIKAELDLVRYIVKNSSVLEKVNIFVIKRRVNSELIVKRKLSKIQKGSPSIWDIQFQQ